MMLMQGPKDSHSEREREREKERERERKNASRVIQFFFCEIFLLRFEFTKSSSSLELGFSRL